jgi:hypothetical protein
VYAYNNWGNGAALSNSGATGYSVTVDPSYFYNNGQGGSYGDGLDVASKGDISLSDVYAYNNWGNGAALSNSGATGYSVTVDPSYFYNNGLGGSYGDGLDVASGGAISLSDVYAHNNWGNGAALSNTAATGYSVAADSSSFYDNGQGGSYGDGLDIASKGNISLSDVYAHDNFGNGAALSNTGATGYGIFIDPSAFNSNGLDGLHINSSGGVLFTDVTASGNSGYGAYIVAGSSIIIDPSAFNNNGSDGVSLSTPGDATIICSTFENNSGDGIDANLPGILAVWGDTFSGNASGDVNLTGGGTLDFRDSCQGPKKPAPGGPSLPWHIVPLSEGQGVGVPVTGGEGIALDCTQYRGTMLVLPNRDQIILPCPISGQAALKHQAQDGLPGPLDSKFSFVSAMDAEVSPSLSGTMLVDFFIPPDKQRANLSILHWDGSQWVELGGAKTADGFFEIPSSLAGVFVLVTK